jgi:murein peptide amidase A
MSNDAAMLVREGSSPRRIDPVLAPLEQLSGALPNLFAKPLGPLSLNGRSITLPRYIFQGSPRGEEAIRLGLFAAIHGDEPEGTYALIELLQVLSQHPELAAGYCLFLYPVCNPTGFEANTRFTQSGQDLNREFWGENPLAEISLLQSELIMHAFHGLVSLHSDNDSNGLYGFARGATMTHYLLEPALSAAEKILPRNIAPVIDGFEAKQGIIHSCYKGVLSSPKQLRPRPFEIVFETPQKASQLHQTQAAVVALLTILSEYRKFIAYAANL